MKQSNGPRGAWEEHYQRPRSQLSHPDENLVRALALAERAGIHPDGALDFGCGSGRHTALLVERGWSNVQAVDVSETAIRACARLVPQARFEQVSEDGRLPHADESFSLVVSWGVLHYNAPDIRERMVAEAHRVLRPGGWFVGTLRGNRESHIQNNVDLPGTDVALFDQSAARELLATAFLDCSWGYQERTPFGELDRRICHWMFLAKRDD